MPSVTKNQAFCLGHPSPPANEPHNFLCEIAPYIEICYAYYAYSGAGPSPKVRAFSNSGWPDSDKSCGSIACPYSTILCPYSQKNRRTIIRDVQIETTSNHMHYRNFGNVHFAGSTLGNGLSGEP